MKEIIKLLVLPLLFSYTGLSAQVETNFNNLIEINEQGQFIKPYKKQVDVKLPSKSIDSLLRIELRDLAISRNEKPFQLAVPVKIDLNIAKRMQWNYFNDSAYGRFTIKADGALSTSINFNKFFLPIGTEMYIYNDNGNMITGPITERENNEKKDGVAGFMKANF
ncbi:MAG: hypothetical protein J5I50_08040 [Chitinophagaceae bacterium]|nr:hypothetical protein [Chitinophagaceae bacterium]